MMCLYFSMISFQRLNAYISHDIELWPAVKVKWSNQTKDRNKTIVIRQIEGARYLYCSKNVLMFTHMDVTRRVILKTTHKLCEKLTVLTSVVFVCFWHYQFLLAGSDLKHARLFPCRGTTALLHPVSCPRNPW